MAALGKCGGRASSNEVQLLQASRHSADVRCGRHHITPPAPAIVDCARPAEGDVIGGNGFRYAAVCGSKIHATSQNGFRRTEEASIVALFQRNLFPSSVPSGSSGDGASNPTGSQVDPNTGDTNPDNRPAGYSTRQSTAGSDRNQGTPRGDELVNQYRAGAASVRGIDPDLDSNQMSGMAIGGGHDGDGTDGFRTTGGHFVDDQTGAGYGVAGEDHLVTHQASLPRDTNLQSGKAI